MTGVLRLIRINLLLRLVPALIGYVVLLLRADQNGFEWLSIALLPTLLVLFLSYFLEQRKRISPTTIRWLLSLVLITNVLEYAISTSMLLAAARNNLVPTEVLSRLREERNFSNVGANYLLSLIPSVLGVWLDGRKGVIRWTLLCVLLNVAGLLSIAGIDWVLGTDLVAVRGQLASSVAFMIVTGVVCYFVGALADQQREEHAALEAANKRLAEQAYVREQLVANQERMQLSRDLHDTVAHTLAALAVQINAINTVLVGEQPDARRELDKAAALVREGLDSTRHAIGDLRANQVEDFGLSGALHKLVESFTQRLDIPAELNVEGDPSILNPQTANTVYRIAQESLNNIERHAQASQVEIQLTIDAQTHHFTCSISDDGIGFDQHLLADERFGLRGMRERAEIIGAHLRIDSVVGKGTTIRLQGQTTG